MGQGCGLCGPCPACPRSAFPAGVTSGLASVKTRQKKLNFSGEKPPRHLETSWEVRVMKPTKKQSLKPFVKKCCLIAENAKYPALELYLTYVNWCLNYGKTVHDQFTFLDMLEEQGFPYHSAQPGGTIFQGISVLPHYRIDD
jgi:hypothetical protein